MLHSALRFRYLFYYVPFRYIRIHSYPVIYDALSIVLAGKLFPSFDLFGLVF